MTEDSRSHPLDRPSARVVAVGVALSALAVLAVIHRDDLMPMMAGASVAADDPLSRCIAEHHATIDKGIADGVFKPDQAALFKQRAEALCRSTVPQ
jgi:hypothetical protein